MVANSVEYSDIEGGYTGTGNTNDAPQFRAQVSFDYRLSRFSPVINLADPMLDETDFTNADNDGNGDTTDTATDLDGGTRIIDSRADMGAYEYFFACLADFNNDCTVDPDDLADYVAAFFADPPDPSADQNGDNMVDPDDLADFIDKFFDEACGQ